MSSDSSAKGFCCRTTSIRAVPPSAETNRAPAPGGPSVPNGRLGPDARARDRRVPRERERQRVELLEPLRTERLLARRQRDIDARRGELAAWEAATQQLEAAHGLGVAREALELVVVRLEGEQARDEHRQHRHRSRQRRARAAQHEAADPAVEAASPVLTLRRLLGHGRGRVEARLLRPVGAASDDGEQRRDQRERRQHHQPHRDGDHRTERLVGAQDRKRQGGGGDQDRGAGRGDGAADASHRATHRLVPVGVARELLAEAGGDEEHVVRAGAEEHDCHDPRGLPGDGQVELLGDRCADRAGDLEDETNRQQGDQRDDGRAIDQEQQHQHQQYGDDQQDRVDVREDLDEVDDQAAGAADGDLDAGQVERRGAVADRGDGIGERGLGGLPGETGEEVEGRAVRGNQAGPGALGRPWRTDLRDGIRRLGSAEPGLEIRDGGPGRLAEPGGFADDDQRRRAGGGEALLRQLEGASRLRVGGKEERSLVLRDFVEARELRDQGSRDQDPDEQRDPFAARAADEVGYAAEHGLSDPDPGARRQPRGL